MVPYYCCSLFSAFLTTLTVSRLQSADDGMVMNVEQMMEWELADKQKYLENTRQKLHFVHHKPHLNWNGIEPVPPRWEASDWLPEPWHDPDYRYRIIVLIFSYCLHELDNSTQIQLQNAFSHVSLFSALCFLCRPVILYLWSQFICFHF